MDARTRLGPRAPPDARSCGVGASACCAGWIRLYEEVGDAGVVCRRCGISRPALRKWWRRYRAEGEPGLESRSRRPHASPNRKVGPGEEALILGLRRERRLGVKRLRNELIREHGLKLAIDTVHKVLVRHGERYLKRRPLRRKGSKRYSRPVPGDRVQVDVCKIGPGLYQCTAIDDCSRFQVVGIHPRRTAANTLTFLDRVLEEMPFAVQRIQTDRGQEFFAYQVQDQLRARRVEFRPIRPRSRHLNGPRPADAGRPCGHGSTALRSTVERAQRTVLDEFWPTVDLKAATLPEQLDEWQHFHNRQRPHGALGGRAPIDRVGELIAKTPLSEDVWDAYDPAKETIRTQDYRWDATFAHAQR